MLLNLKNTQYLCSLLALALAPMTLFAAVTDSAVCLREGITRIVELRAESPAGVPCSVDYLKPDEGQPEQRLWVARNDPNYCVTQFESFLVRLENEHDWSCETQGAAVEQSASMEEQPLSPGDEEIPALEEDEILDTEEEEILALEKRLLALEEERTLALEEKLLALEKERLLALEEEQILVPEEERILAPEEERILAPEEERLLALERERILALEQEQILASEEEKLLARERERILALEQEQILASEEEKLLALERERTLALEQENVLALEEQEVLAPEEQEVQELAASAADKAQINSAICLRNGTTRIVELRVEGPTGVPCSVDYIKPDENQPEQRLWVARNDANYCVAQFESFVMKLEDELDWSCETQGVTVAQSGSGKEKIPTLEQERILALEQEKSRALEEERILALEQEKSRALEEERILALEQEKSRALEEERFLALEQEKSRALEEERILALEQEKSRALEEERILALEQERSRALEQERSRALEEERILALEQERSRALEQERSRALEQERSRALEEERILASEKQEAQELAVNAADVVQKKSAVCLRDEITRIVELHAEGPTGVPCSVDYIKPDEGVPGQRLWVARNDANYCVTQFESFLMKLEDELDWSCEMQGVTLASATDVAEQIDERAAQLLPQPNQQNISTAGIESVPELQSEEPSPEVTQPINEPLTPTDTNSPITAPEITNGLDFADIRTAIPTGFYSADPSIPHKGAVQQCPADGYFIWNRRVFERPVLEMGPMLEFAIRLGSVNDINNIRAETNDPNRYMALRPLNSLVNISDNRSEGVQLVITSADKNNKEQKSRAVCRYVRG